MAKSRARDLAKEAAWRRRVGRFWVYLGDPDYMELVPLLFELFCDSHFASPPCSCSSIAQNTAMLELL